MQREFYSGITRDILFEIFHPDKGYSIVATVLGRILRILSKLMQLYNPSLSPCLYVAPVENIVGRAPLMAI